MEKFSIFLERVKSEFPELVCKFISFVLGKPKHLGEFDILGSKAFKENFKLGVFVRENFTEIMKESSENLWEINEVVDFIIDILNTQQLLEYKTVDGINILSLLVKHSESNTIWKCLEKTLPKDESEELIKERLKVVLEKDDSGLNIIDYSFLRRKNVVGEYVKGMIKRLKGGIEDQNFPELVQVETVLSRKSEEQIESESSLIEKDLKILAKLTNKKVEPKMKDLKGVELKPFRSKGIVDTELLKELKKIYDLIEEEYSEKVAYFSIHNLDYPTVYIKTEEQLQQMVEELKECKILGFDVEFSTLQSQTIENKDMMEDEDDEYLIKQVAASVQISSLKKSYFIDCLAIQPQIIKKHLGKVLASETQIKIFHSCESDINILYQTFGIMVKNIFDTSRAYKIIFHTNRTISLRNLSKIALKVDIDKCFQVATWRVRPLPNAMVEYGLIDSFLLLPLFWVFWQITFFKKDPADFGFDENIPKGDRNLEEVKIWARSNNIAKWIKPVDFNVKYKNLA